MIIVEDSVRIAVPANAIFWLSQDYSLRTAWDPFVKEMRFLNGARFAAKDVSVWVRAWTGMTMVVRFVSFQPPCSVAMKMNRGPRLFEKFAGAWLFKEVDANTTDVTFRYAFTTRWKNCRLFLDPAIRRLFQMDVRARLRGLKDGVESLGLLNRLAAAVRNE